MFDNILGNEKIKKELENAVKINKCSHSYLFLGTPGIGKKRIGREFAKMILCLDENKYCNKCKSCIEFNSENNPDFQEIKPDGANIKIDQIREMQRKVSEQPIISNKKVYLIDDADLMTKEAQNCLLKTLEEPPEFVIIILIGANESNFLSTIKSRCLILKFENLRFEEIKDYLEKEFQNESISKSIIEASNGSIGKALSLKNKQELYNSIDNIISNIERKDLIDILNDAEIIYKSQDEKFEILEYMNILLFEKAKENLTYLNAIKYVEETKNRLKANCNYSMTIDRLIMSIWEEIH